MLLALVQIAGTQVESVEAPWWETAAQFAGIVSAAAACIAAWLVWCAAKSSSRAADTANEIAGKTLENARAGLMYDVLMRSREEYETPDMKDSIRALRDFVGRCENGKDINKTYFDRLKEAKKQGRRDPDIDRHQRRVSHFYQKLADIHHLGLVTGGLLLEPWSRSDLEIIIEAIIPMENALAEFRKTPDAPLRTLKKLKRFHDDACAYLKAGS